MYSKPSLGAAVGTAVAAPAVFSGKTTVIILVAILMLVMVGLITVRLVSRRNARNGRGRGGRH